MLSELGTAPAAIRSGLPPSGILTSGFSKVPDLENLLDATIKLTVELFGAQPNTIHEY
jgi:hypothetical protein